MTDQLLMVIIALLALQLVLLKEIEENVEDLFYKRRHESFMRRLHRKLFGR